MECKIFSRQISETAHEAELESRINEWLKQHGNQIKIIATQTAAASASIGRIGTEWMRMEVVITIWFDRN
jgi:hypothetical protein